MNWILTNFHLGVAGLGPMIWHWGVGVGLIIVILGVEVFSGAIGAQFPFAGTFLNSIRKDLLWAAAVIAVFLGGEAVGAHDEAYRNDAKAAVVSTTVDRAIVKSRRDGTNGMRDRWDRDGQ